MPRALQTADSRLPPKSRGGRRLRACPHFPHLLDRALLVVLLAVGLRLELAEAARAARPQPGCAQHAILVLLRGRASERRAGLARLPGASGESGHPRVERRAAVVALAARRECPQPA